MKVVFRDMSSDISDPDLDPSFDLFFFSVKPWESHLVSSKTQFLFHQMGLDICAPSRASQELGRKPISAGSSSREACSNREL